MIVLEKIQKTYFNDSVAWKQWRLCPGRKWRTEGVHVSRAADPHHLCRSAPPVPAECSSLHRERRRQPSGFLKKWDHLLGCGRIHFLSCGGWFWHCSQSADQPERTSAVWYRLQLLPSTGGLWDPWRVCAGHLCIQWRLLAACQWEMTIVWVLVAFRNYAYIWNTETKLHYLI